MSEVSHEQQPHWPTVDTAELQYAAQQGIGATLHTGRQEVEVPISPEAGAFTERAIPSTGGRESLTHILQAGDTLFGIASRRNPNAGYGKQDELRVYALPFGANADMPAAKLVSEGPFAKIGRTDMLDKGLANDDKMSRNHAEVVLIQQGQSLALKIEDAESSNGTQLWSAGALRHPSVPESLRSVAQSLKDPRMWPAEAGNVAEQLPVASGDHHAPVREFYYEPAVRNNMNRQVRNEKVVLGEEQVAQRSEPGLVAILQVPKSEQEAEDLYVIDVAGLPNSGSTGKSFEGRRLDPHTQYVVVNPRLLDLDKGTGIQEIGGQGRLIYGRKSESSHQFFPDNAAKEGSPLTSGRHFSLYVDRNGEKLTFEDHSSNGTRILMGENAEEYLAVREARSLVDDIHSDYTFAAIMREPTGHLRRKDLYGGNTPIDRNTTHFEGVVDVRSNVEESIVVDSSANETRGAYAALREKFVAAYNALTPASGFEGTFEERTLVAAYNAVQDVMAYDLEYVTEKTSALGDAYTDKRTNLGEYLEAGKGVCRHMALAVAWLGTETGTKREQQGGGRSMFPGVITTHANYIEGDIAGHQWVRYESTDGKIYIVDPAQDFVGTLEAATRRGHGWEYRTEEERRTARGGALFSYVK